MAEPSCNRFLACLSDAAKIRLLRAGNSISLPVRASLFAAGTQPDFIYLLNSGLASTVIVTADGETAEVEMTGCEGPVGGISLLGPTPFPTTCFMQLAGDGVRIRRPVFAELVQGSAEIRSRLMEHIQMQSFLTSQAAGCHALHEVEARLARWLLMAQERAQSAFLPLTQEFLAEMMGSRRTTVTMAASAMQRNGLIEYARGKLTIVDRAGLENAACSCYSICKNLFEGLYAQPTE